VKEWYLPNETVTYTKITVDADWSGWDDEPFTEDETSVSADTGSNETVIRDTTRDGNRMVVVVERHGSETGIPTRGLESVPLPLGLTTYERVGEKDDRVILRPQDGWFQRSQEQHRISDATGRVVISNETGGVILADVQFDITQEAGSHAEVWTESTHELSVTYEFDPGPTDFDFPAWTHNVTG